MVNIIIPRLKRRKRRLVEPKRIAPCLEMQARARAGAGAELGVALQHSRARSVTQPKWGQSRRRSDHTWGSGRCLLGGLCFPSFQH